MIDKEILLVGNPNVGKSTVFNILCNKKQKTGNYSGVTVSSYSGTYQCGKETVTVTDLPGAYSIYPSSQDENVFSDYLLNQRQSYAGVVYVLDALNINRGLLLFKQIQDLGIPIILIINQIDEAERRGVQIDSSVLAQNLGVTVIKMSARKKEGLEELREAIYKNSFSVAQSPSFEIPFEQRKFFPLPTYENWVEFLSNEQLAKSKNIVAKRLQTQETVRRYQSIDKLVAKAVIKRPEFTERFTESIDKLLVHPILGYVVFGILLLLMFNCIFFLAEYPMVWIETLFLGDGEAIRGLAGWANDLIPQGPLNSLLVNGVIAGIAGIVVFAPQIFILFYFLYILEDSGYMARVVFLMDRFLRPFGLSGKSVVPLVSGAACAVPAIMGARSIENTKERLLTVLVTPFMTCSARLPIYSILIALIVPNDYFMGISYKAFALLGMYLLGVVVALLSSLILNKFMKAQERSYLVMDLPNYKMPLWMNDFRLTLGRVWDFIYNAGRIIFAVSIILWALAYFGPSKKQDQWLATDVEMKDSYLTTLGEKIEPIVTPLGYDWKMGVAIITSFAAREVFVGTMAVLYGLDENTDPESEEGERLILGKMRGDRTSSGQEVFSTATGISLLLFYAFAMQCIATIATVYRETKNWKWTLGQLVGMSGLAYFIAFIVYQILS